MWRANQEKASDIKERSNYLLQSLEIAFVEVMRLRRNGQKVTEIRESMNAYLFRFLVLSVLHCIIYMADDGF